MRLVMMGTGPFAVPTFRGLYETHHTVAALVTGPLRGRGPHSVAATPMRAVALEHGTPIVDPEDSNTPEAQAQLAGYEPDLLIVCDYGQILSVGTLATAGLGGINLHASLLPKFRGAAPINWALYYGEKETGVSVIHMTPQIDAGPVIAQGSMADTSETKTDEQVKQWYDFCAQMREAASGLNKAIHAGDESAADAAMKKLTQSCDDCHAVFHKEEAK